MTEEDREIVRNAEQELHAIRLKDNDYDFSKVVSIIRKLINILTVNVIVTRSLTSDCILHFVTTHVVKISEWMLFF